MRLGVLDTQRPDWVRELVPHLDALGYSRYWAAEQRSVVQSASPTILAAIAGGLSGRLRIGTAGVLLCVYSPLKVAEDFRVLQQAFPGRIDLGMAGAVPAEPHLSALLDGRPPLGSETYAQKVRALVRLVRDDPAATQGSARALLGPRCEGTPELWLCGTTERSARLAAELGICYSFHDFLARAKPGSPEALDGPAVVRAYREAFRPGPSLPAPRFNVACYGVAAASSEQAAALWRSALPAEARKRPMEEQVGPSFCGTLAECRQQLRAQADRYGTDELVVQSVTVDFEACLNSYSLLADACRIA
jgi:luciferase family oxidoreductase group 1